MMQDASETESAIQARTRREERSERRKNSKRSHYKTIDMKKRRS